MYAVNDSNGGGKVMVAVGWGWGCGGGRGGDGCWCRVAEAEVNDGFLSPRYRGHIMAKKKPPPSKCIHMIYSYFYLCTQLESDISER